MKTSLASASLAEWLSGFLHDEKVLAKSDVMTDVHQLDGGWSRNTYLAVGSINGADAKCIIRAEVGGGLTGTPLETEYAIYRDLQAFDVKTPRVLANCSKAENPFGGPFFVMDHLEGVAPNLWRWEAHLPLAENWADNRSIAKDFVETLAAIHLITPEKAPRSLDILSARDLIIKWKKVYEENRLARDPIVEEALACLAENLPEPGRIGLVHGDYRPGNLLMKDGHITGVLDWELAHIGDVNYDLGYATLKYVAGKHLRPKTELVSGVADKEWFFAEYERLTGDKVDRDAMDWWSILTLVALIVMAMIGFKAFASGATPDIRRIWSRWALPGLRQELTQIAKW